MTARDLSALPDDAVMAALRASAPESVLLAAADTLARVQSPAVGREFTIEIPPRTVLLNANDRPNHYARARIVKNLRTIAHQLAVIRRVPRLDRVEITGFVHPPDGRARDPHNWYPTLKAAIDGTRDAGVITDDSSRFVVRTDMLLGTRTRYLSFSFEIRELL